MQSHIVNPRPGSGICFFVQLWLQLIVCKIFVKVKSNDDGNTDILEWMCDTYMSKSGVISFPNRQGGEMKRLEFKEGYVVEYTETYDSSKMQDEGEIHQFEEFTITCKEIQVGMARHNNRWTIDN